MNGTTEAILEVPRRRQGRSCDQCRKGKRACDLAVFDVPPDALQRARLPTKGSHSISVFGPCSNCRRWRKQCTFEWLTLNAGKRATKDIKKPSLPREKRTKTPLRTVTEQPLIYEQMPTATQSSWDTIAKPAISSAGELLWSAPRGAVQWSQPPPTVLTASTTSELTDPPDDEESTSTSSTADLPTVPPADPSTAKIPARKLSPVEALAQQHTRAMVTRDLLRIYHDSLENTLTCVLTERTCPYSEYFCIQRPPQLSNGTQWGSKWSNRMCGRICRLDRAYSAVRGRHLTQTEERAVSKALHTTIMAFAMQWRKGQPRARRTSLTLAPRVELPSAEISRAMLTNYWNEASHALRACGNIESMRLIFAYMLFSVINRPLDEGVCHQILQPMKEKPTLSPEPGAHPSNPSTTTTKPSVAEQLHRVLDLEEAPLFLETGIRRLLVCRYKIKQMQRVEAAQRKTRSASISSYSESFDSTSRSSGSSAGESEKASLNSQERETFNLLYWLGIIIDTMASAVYGRPVIISDEDSTVSLDLPGQNRAVVPAGSSQVGSASMWNDLFLRSGALADSQHESLWPCTFERATAIVCDASPVKLLLFRRITRLQSMLYRSASPEELEEVIDDSQRLLNFWGQTYGRFANELMAHHDELPPRLQSWYVIVIGHWQLAVILFAEMVQEIDGALLGLDHRREIRQAAGFATGLKREHAMTASDLARLCLQDNNTSLVNAQELHELFQAGIILTEPWVNILIRLFSKAGLVLLDDLNQQRQYTSSQVVGADLLFEDTRQRCGYCIQALRCLGKMCDTADLAAQTLSDSLDQTILRHSPSLSHPDMGWSLDMPFVEQQILIS